MDHKVYLAIPVSVNKLELPHITKDTWSMISFLVEVSRIQTPEFDILNITTITVKSGLGCS